MPGFNGTGPLSRGSFTGKGQGYCISQVGEGTCRGVGRGRGTSRGRRNCRSAVERGAGTPEGVRQELDLLRERVKDLEAALKLVAEKGDQRQVTD